MLEAFSDDFCKFDVRPFHKEIPDKYVDRVFDTMEAADWHVFQVLTKRSSIMRDFLRERYRAKPAPAHMWFGVSVEDDKRYSRIRHLQESPAAVRFLSIEPLIGSIGKLELSGIHWVIVGGESGPKARPMNEDWVRDIRDQCLAANVAFFFKQWGGRSKKATGRALEGRTWNQFPAMNRAKYELRPSLQV